jgi:hypothetical protein
MESANRRGRAQVQATRETGFDKRIILAVNIDFSNVIDRFGVAPVVRTRNRRDRFARNNYPG